VAARAARRRVTDFTAGDEVYGLIAFDRDGAGAEYVTVPVIHLSSKPRTVLRVEVAALPLAALTAWQALVDALCVVSARKHRCMTRAEVSGRVMARLESRLRNRVVPTGAALSR
jgi:NADPH:quinone reductase-like Zn-dependent oxidoreductase